MKSFRFVLLMIVFACGPKTQQSIVGSYKSKEYNFIENAIKQFKNEPYTKGSKLHIKKDSTYTQITCGNTVTGTWRIAGDILLLKSITNRFNNDSLNRYGLNGKQPKVGTGQDSIKIEGNKLIFKLKFKGIDKTLYEVMLKDK